MAVLIRTLHLQRICDIRTVSGPVQMDQLVQMMGRLDRPAQTSHKLCRAILYMKLGQDLTFRALSPQHLQLFVQFVG